MTKENDHVKLFFLKNIGPLITFSCPTYMNKRGLNLVKFYKRTCLIIFNSWNSRLTISTSRRRSCPLRALNEILNNSV